MARQGLTKEHYQKQKGQCYAYFKVNPQDAAKMDGAQFTIYDFITNAFAFSHARKQAAVAVLMALKEKPRTFTELIATTGCKKSSLYLLCLSLERSGLIAREGGRDKPYRISKEFSDALAVYASWWARWSGVEGSVG